MSIFGIPKPVGATPPAAPTDGWFESQGVELSRVDLDEVWWRCPVCGNGGRTFDGLMEAKRIGMNHGFEEHDLPKERRSEARKAARRVGGRTMLVDRFEAMVARLAERFDVPVGNIHRIVSSVASGVMGYSAARDVMFHIGKAGLVKSRQAANEVVDAVCEELGYRGWRERAGGDAHEYYQWPRY